MHNSYHKKIVLIDFDDVIFDTAKLRKRRLALLRRFGLSLRHDKEAKRKMMREAVSFHPILHLKYLTGDKELRKRIAGGYERLLSKPRHYNFPGAADFLRRLSRKYRLLLLTYGYRDFQLKKFKQSGFKEFFRGAIVTKNLHKRRDLALFRKRYGQSVLIIDDSIGVIRAARAVGMKAIRIKKGNKNAIYYKKLAKRIESLL